MARHGGRGGLFVVAVHRNDLGALVLCVPGGIAVGSAEQCGGDEEAALLLAGADQQRRTQLGYRITAIFWAGSLQSHTDAPVWGSLVMGYRVPGGAPRWRPTSGM